ncbi:MAG: PorV/PorQ family protein [candidate division FCPU426 bacterium]
MKPGDRRKSEFIRRMLATGLFCLAGAQAWAGEGTTGMEFIRLHPGARSAGLAGTYLANGDDAESLYSNPAGAAGLLSPQIGFSHLVYWEGVTYDALWAGLPIGENQFAGLNVAYFNLPPFNSTADDSLPSAHAQGLVGSASYILKIQRFMALSGGLKYILSRLTQDQASAAAVDVGVKCFALNDQLTLAAVARNLGVATAFVEARDSMPMEGGIGAAYQFWPGEICTLTLAADAIAPFQGKPALTAGMEFWYQQFLAVRCGLKKDNDVGDWLALGAGLRWQRLHLDYAISPLSSMGMVHRISVGYDFGNQKQLARPKLEVTLLTKQSLGAGGQVVRTVHWLPRASAAAGLDQWELKISDSQARLMRKYSGRGDLPAEIIWDGLDDQGRRTDAEGTFEYRLRIVDQQGYDALCSGEILPVSITRLPKLKALPRDIYAGQVGFNPKQVSDLKEWEFKVMAPDGRLIKRQTGVGPIPKDLGWNGQDEKNRPMVARKGFYFVVQYKDKLGNESTSRAPLIIADSESKAKTSEDLAINEEVHFRFEGSKAVKMKEWSLDITDKSTGKVIKSITHSGQLPEKVSWDSKDEQGRPVSSRQEYGFILRFQDQMGNVWQQAQPIRPTPVKVQTAKPGKLLLKIEGVLFDFNRAELKPEMFEKITEVARLIKAYPGKKAKLLIEGHTDDIGNEPYNLELSNKRAKMVMRFLVEEQGLSSAAIDVVGYGKSKPVSADQDKNRRVEINLEIDNNPR